MDKVTKKDTGRFVTVASSGSVTVDLGKFLKSDDGKKQLSQIRELRNFTRNTEGSARKKEG